MMDCKKCLEQKENYFDRQVSGKNRKAIKNHLENCPDCSGAFKEYEQMFGELKNLETKKCPDEIVDSVYQILSLDETRERRKPVWEFLTEFFFMHTRQLKFAVVAVSIFLLTVLVYDKINQPQNLSTEYTTEEIAEATDQVKLALAYFNQATSRTEEILQKQVLPEQVIKPMKASIKTAFKPLMNGG